MTRLQTCEALRYNNGDRSIHSNLYGYKARLTETFRTINSAADPDDVIGDDRGGVALLAHLVLDRAVHDPPLHQDSLA